MKTATIDQIYHKNLAKGLIEAIVAVFMTESTLNLFPLKILKIIVLPLRALFFDYFEEKKKLSKQRADNRSTGMMCTVHSQYSNNTAEVNEFEIR